MTDNASSMTSQDLHGIVAVVTGAGSGVGRATAMDAATIKGVVGRLVRRRLVVTVPSPEDRRRLVVGLTPEGRALFADLAVRGLEASRRTIDRLTPAERQRFLALLRKLL